MFWQHAAIHRRNLGVFARRRRAASATQCRTFPVEFVCVLSRTDNADADAGSGYRGDSELHTRAGAILLNFTSSLHSGFRFGLNRHKFATGLAPGMRLQEPRRSARGQSSPDKARDSRHRAPAEALSKG
jgi:hypothetical protein